MDNEIVHRLKTETLVADINALAALRRLSDYALNNPVHPLSAMETLNQLLNQAREEELNARNAAAAARDALSKAKWALHNGMLGVKSQVRGQYGEDSDALQSLGLKKKSKHRRSTSRAPKNSQNNPEQPGTA
jgi:hypothetical protein